MASNKTRPPGKSVEKFLNAVPDERERQDSLSLVELVETVTGEALDDLARREEAGGIGAAKRNAVFIVGMPGSGTTLLEQMLERHPRMTGCGELNFLSEFAVQ